MQYHRVFFFFLAGILLLAWSPALPTLRAQTVIDTLLVMDDGVRIDALYVLPLGPPPSNGYPGILLVHGFAGSKNNNRATALAYARAGYAATAYSVRGQGNSEGFFTFFAAPRILDDLRTALRFTRTLRGVDSTRVAVVGGSQGGLHAWNAAAYDMGARCVVSMIANGRFDENFLENEALNWTFAAATTTTDVRFEPAVSTMFRQAREGGDFRVLGPFLREQSTAEREASVSTPTAMLISYYDGFFNQNAALRQFAAIPAAKRIVLYPGGHDFPSDPLHNRLVRVFIDRWLAYWLKDDTTVADVVAADSALVFFDAATGSPRAYATADSAQWLGGGGGPPPGMQRLDFFFAPDGLAAGAPTTRAEQTIPYINVLGSTPISYRSAPLDRDIVVLPPAGDATLRTRGSAAPHQMSVFLYDVDPVTGRRVPLCRGHHQTSVTNIEQPLRFDLTSTLHTLRQGHRIEAVVSAGLPLIPEQSSVFGNFVLGSVSPSLNTFITGGDDASRISLFIADDGVTTTTETIHPAQPRLLPAWPNPATAAATVGVHLSAPATIRLTMHDALGRERAVIAEGPLPPGRRHYTVNTSEYRSGLYYYRLLTEGHVVWHRLHVLH
ncbi:MAG: alpha/beta fold hydrolase [Bacteroidota bacterium]|jgi:pimeloyl-ACP methyl ester carboxylesterase|nr:alpha/beta fold hydrolase [Bacteroidota bacterium]